MRRSSVMAVLSSLVLLAMQGVHGAAAQTPVPEQVAASSPRTTPFGHPFIAPAGFYGMGLFVDTQLGIEIIITAAT